MKTTLAVYFIVSTTLSGWALTATAEEKPAIHLQSTFIGDQDEPAISHFVQWKPTQSNDYLRWDVKPKISDDVLKVADRDVVKRRMDIYHDLSLEKAR